VARASQAATKCANAGISSRKSAIGSGAALVHREGESFWSEVIELPGCFASARTLPELREPLADVVGLYLWDMPAQISDTPLSVGETHA
jgi:predicted RNase H-like HicB family nuclease